MPIVDRILTIVVTATLTSAVWIVAGGSFIKTAADRSQPAQAASGPTTPATGTPAGDPADDPGIDRNSATALDAASAGQLIIPVAGVRPGDLSDTFGDERAGGKRLHEALDIMAAEGTPVIAAAPGKIEKLFHSDAGGKTIYVRSDDRRTIYYYAHLRTYTDGLKEGQTIDRGQPLGEVGHTGNASAEAPHLHFAIMRTTDDADWWEPANAVNPYPLLAGKR